ncbi:hypothetical protein C474_05555 [Halogeometricum pallidum JCM 14848]|uniref:YrhK domain-containing protein n=1 Tax=Halogeometricum pallidum JCM 14848 TaxID=1227487 RepID=M0DDH7_HALPD|nr:YrhK family protein [Halogeometricum pallidum]ELZ33521.1 hypothetical protein C474_05555 [Halogeometricum pallidum JCM 14848]
MLKDALQTLFQEYEWVHLSLGLLGNVLFFVGSVFFLYEPLKRLGIYAFIVGSFLMLVGSLGQAVVRCESNDS